MVFLITFCMFALFSTFFYLIGLWYLALLPLAVLVFMLSHGIKNIFTGIKLEILREKWSLILIWLITMIGLSWILFFLWIKEISVYMSLLILNILLMFGSRIFNYEDGNMIFEIWAWLILIVILWTVLFAWWFPALFSAILLLGSLMLWVYAFLQFVIWIFYSKDERWLYEIGVLWAIVVWWSIINYFYPAEWVFALLLFVLALVFCGIYIVQKREMPAKQTTMISVRRILAGERIFKKLNVPKWKIALHEWLENSPKRFDRIFEFFNIGLLIFLLLFFFWWIFTSSEVSLWFGYWLGIAVFLINTFLLKRIWYATDVSRFALALIANFVLYSVLLISGSSIETILPFLIVWGFLCQIALFFVDRINLTFFSDKDFVYRMVSTFIAFICNIILLCRVGLPGQFLFSVIFVYVGAELALMYYIFRFLNDRRERIANAEAEEKKLIKELASGDIESEE